MIASTTIQFYCSSSQMPFLNRVYTCCLFFLFTLPFWSSLQSVHLYYVTVKTSAKVIKVPSALLHPAGSFQFYVFPHTRYILRASLLAQ